MLARLATKALSQADVVDRPAATRRADVALEGDRLSPDEATDVR
jgi:hypothetical protein